jgi:hypothetical protein
LPTCRANIGPMSKITLGQRYEADLSVSVVSFISCSMG